jgi:hypothetical protein
MVENKTKPNQADVDSFLDGIENPRKRDDCREIASMMKEITGSEPVMWGDSIVGFGDLHYRYASGREGDWFLTGFSPRKQNLTLYFTNNIEDFRDMLKNLGKFKAGKGCLYINWLEDIDRDVLRELISTTVKKQTNSS